jgi:hypothetical protein
MTASEAKKVYCFQGKIKWTPFPPWWLRFWGQTIMHWPKNLGHARVHYFVLPPFPVPYFHDWLLLHHPTSVFTSTCLSSSWHSGTKSYNEQYCDMRELVRDLQKVRFDCLVKVNLVRLCLVLDLKFRFGLLQSHTSRICVSFSFNMWPGSLKAFWIMFLFNIVYYHYCLYQILSPVFSQHYLAYSLKYSEACNERAHCTWLRMSCFVTITWIHIHYA